VVERLELSRELPFIRDRVVECYFWALGVYFEPEYLLARRILIKVIAMTSVIDDIYDVYGTLEELELFSDAIERLTLTHFLIVYSSLCYIIWKSQFTRVYLRYKWDIGAIDQLPKYMKMCYGALLDVYSEMDQKIGEGRSYRARYAREAVSNIIHTKI
jgi:(-)-germacrene D synthase